MENKEKKGGFFEQIQGNINPVVLEYYYGPKMKESDTSFPYLVRVMKAHVIMLKEQGIIPEEAARRLLSVMEGWGERIPTLDPSLEDLYINLEHLITVEAGEDICSYLPVARSRNDVEAAMWRIELRENCCIWRMPSWNMWRCCTGVRRKPWTIFSRAIHMGSRHSLSTWVSISQASRLLFCGTQRESCSALNGLTKTLWERLPCPEQNTT